VASFVRDTGQADRYADLKVNYINHHNPDLVLFDEAGEEVQRIDLTRIRTLANIHKLLGLLGMKENCRDLNPSCGEWQRAGQCSANPQFMLMNCRLSCGECSEKASSGSAVLCTNSSPESDCDYWAAIGECASNPTFMHASCKRSCGLCVLDRSDEDDDDSGKDEL